MASRSASSRVFLDSLANGMWPPHRRPRGRRTRSSAPGPNASSTRRRTSSRSMPSAASELASDVPSGRVARAAPVQVRLDVGAPHREPLQHHHGQVVRHREQGAQQVPGVDRVVPALARLLLRQHHGGAGLLGEPLEEHDPPPETASRCATEPGAAVLLVHRLPADRQGVRDLLPGPALGARVGDLQLLQRLQEPPQGGDRREPDGRVPTRRRRRDLRMRARGVLAHAVNIG